MAQSNPNAAVRESNGLGPQTHIVTYDDLDLAATQIQNLGATIAGIDTATTSMAVQTTWDSANVAALANVTAVSHTFNGE
jgi:hypothetical protein